MSGGDDSGQLLGSSIGAEDGESNGFIHVYSSSVDADSAAAGTAADDEEVSVSVVPADVARMSDDSVNQESGIEEDNNILSMEADDVHHQPNEVKVTEDGAKEDMFVDCPEDWNAVPDNKEATEIPETPQSLEEKDEEVTESHVNESGNETHTVDMMGELEHLRALLATTVDEKESFARDYEEERRSFMKEFANLHHQLMALRQPKSLLNENDVGWVDHLHNAESAGDEKKSLLSDSPLDEMANECSKLIKHALDERSQTDMTIRELQATLCTKDQEIENLNARVSELSVSNDVFLTSLSSAKESWSQSLEVSSKVQLEKDQCLEATANRMLASLAMAVNQEDLLDESVTGKLSHIEKSISILIEKYNQFLSESDLLRECLTNIRSDLCAQDKLESFFLAGREELLELKRKEGDLAQQISHLEGQNGELVQQLEKEREIVEKEKSEIQKLRVEVEQEKTKFSNTKEKLSLAVTKGKALVQQRDSLKHALADKSSELEKCLVELQEKSNALKSTELSKEELVQLQDSLKQSLADKTSELEKCLVELQEKSSALEAAELGREDVVQLLDSLRQSLADKTSELEKCLVELQEKSSVLEATELSKEELVRNETLAAALQEALSQRDTMFEKCKEILSQAGSTEELQSLDLIESVRRLAHEKKSLTGISMEFRKIADALSLIALPETVPSSNLESQVSWLVESFYLAKDEAKKLQDEIARTREAAQNEIGLLTASLLAESQEKNYLLEEFEELTQKLEGIVEKEHQVSMEKDRMVGMLLEVSGIARESQEAYQPQSDMGMIIDMCIGKIREQNRASLESSNVGVEVFESAQSLLYIRDLESTMYEQILEEEMLYGPEVDRLSSELVVVSQELSALKEEKGTLQNYLERSEEKAALLREKLSMAVKKGKGLVQERENLKQSLKENNAVIEKLKLELEQKEYAISDCRDQISKLSTDVERIPKLEADFVVMKNQRDDLERFLVESNSMLQRVIESIDDIHLPIDFEEPVEKIKWLAGYLSECQDAKTQVEQELGKVKDEASTLASSLVEAQKTLRSLEDALSVGENNIAKLAEEKRELEIAKAYVEQLFRKATEEASAQSSTLDDVSASKKSLEDALLLAENNISVLINEKEDAQVSRATAEMEVQKLKEEVSVHTSKLSEAYKTIQSLEDAMSQVQTNVSMLTEEYNNTQVGRTILESEVKKLREDADSQASKLADASSTIKSLEDALLKAENTVSSLVDEKTNYEHEISTLNSRLNTCLEELNGTHGNLENRSLELSGHVHSLQLLLKDDTLLSLLRQSFEKKVGSLKDMGDLLTDIWGHFVEMDSEKLQNYPPAKENYSASNLLQAGLDNVVNVEMVNGEVNAVDGDSIMLYIGKTVEQVRLKNKLLADKFESFSTFMDELIAALVTNLQATKDKMLVVLENNKSLKQSMTDMKEMKDVQENTIEILENSITVLVSACTDATRELESEVENRLLELGAVPELEKLNHGLFSDERAIGVDAVADDQLSLDSSKYVKTTEQLLSATKHVRNLIKKFQDVKSIMITTIEDLEGRLQETSTTCEKAIQERDLSQNKVSKLETDLEALENLCSEMRLTLEDYQAKEDKFKEREAELALAYSTSKKEHVAEDPLLSASQMKSLFDKIHGMEIPSVEFEVGDIEVHDSIHVRKLFYIVDSVNTLQRQMTLLSRDKEHLQSTLEEQVLEIEHLKEEVEEQIRDKQDYEKMKNELFELAVGLENIIHKLGGDESIGIQNSAGVTGLLPVLEKLVLAITMESENLRSKAQELGGKLLGTQKVVDELSCKVKLLEDSNPGRDASPETIHDRGVFESTSLSSRSEISEIEDVGPLGKKGIPPAAPSAAHVRTLRKGSSDHLAINVDLESDRLISNEETTEDKGHLFKSLNTSGLVPRQGKTMADRIDGIWVSGGRALMSRPRARLGVIAYWLILHLWLLGTVL